MHKDWARIDKEREKQFWANYEQRPDKYRYVEESDKKNGISDAYVEYWEDVRDENDEPLEDGIYEDNGEDRWIRVNGYWAVASEANNCGAWSKWLHSGAMDYTPFRRVDPSHY